MLTTIIISGALSLIILMLLVALAQERLRGALPGFAEKGGFSNAMIAHRSRQTFPSASQRHTLDVLAVGARW